MRDVSPSEWTAILKAIAHPVRVSVLARLVEGPKCVDRIRDLLEARQSNVSQHLTVLRHAGLVGFSRNGASRCYYLTRPALVKSLFRMLRRECGRVSPGKGDASGGRKRATTARRRG